MAVGIEKSIFSPQISDSFSNKYTTLNGLIKYGTPHNGVLSPYQVGELNHTNNYEEHHIYESIGYDQDVIPQEYFGLPHDNYVLGKYVSKATKEVTVYDEVGYWEHGTRELVGFIAEPKYGIPISEFMAPPYQFVLEHVQHRQKEKYKGLITKDVNGTITKVFIPWEYVVKHEMYIIRQDLIGVYGTPFDRIEKPDRGEGSGYIRPRAYPSTHTPKRR